MAFDLKDLGITQEELADRVVERAVSQLLDGRTSSDDEDEEDSRYSDSIRRRMDEEIKKQIDAAVKTIGDAEVLPRIADAVEKLTIQRTNEWGQKKGEPKTFTEYLIERAEAYITEPVSFDGKTKEEDSYNWRANTTRIAYMINKHLQYSIETAMEKALRDYNSTVQKGLEGAMKIAIANAAEKFKLVAAGQR